jgi:hypothetical protein
MILSSFGTKNKKINPSTKNKATEITEKRISLKMNSIRAKNAVPRTIPTFSAAS